ncbi:MAG TPA: acetyl-CoA hydrolase/transferase C-terminal domain-containing protein [Jiangellales bacterium]|nr:acetyl-CoA hydrolase/transferase C-terminal domain-containing protein [Jiangellales bacterium]
MKYRSEDELAALVSTLRPGARVVCSGNFAMPLHTLGIVDKAVESYRLYVLNAQHGIPDRAGVEHETSFVGPAMRHPRLNYIPARLSLVPQMFHTTLPPDLVVVRTSAPREGTVSLGTEVNVLPAAIEAVRRRGGLVIAETNPRVPFTFGDAVIPTDQIDYAIDVDEPLASPAEYQIEDTARQIGDQVASRVADGSTLQLGIGAIPDAALLSLAEHRGLRIWSEMISDGVLRLERHGRLDPHVPITASFMFGSQELYEWADRNPRLRMLRTETTNDPSRIRAHDYMVSINTALQVDLYGQVNASRIKGCIYSGFGGQTDFIVGALHSRGGQAIIALRSWHPKANCSTIVPMVEEPVTSFQPTAVVTENGMAELFGRPERAQAAALIERAAHPRIRAELWEEARALGLADGS